MLMPFLMNALSWYIKQETRQLFTSRDKFIFSPLFRPSVSNQVSRKVHWQINITVNAYKRPSFNKSNGYMTVVNY